ncbi:hypothetical protein ACOME3_001878 [Neoechinorhynchus agilis]
MTSMTSLIDYFTNNADYTCWIPDNVSMSDAIPINADGKLEKCKVFENYTSLSNKTIPCPTATSTRFPTTDRCYFGFTLSASAFSSNIYLHFFITTIIDIPQIVLCSVATKFFGRKTLSLFTNLLLVVISIIFAVLPTGNQAALNVFNHIAKFSASTNADIVWMLVTELFPTKYRQFGFGFASFVAGIVTALSPFLKDQLTSQRLATMLSIGGFALFAAILIIFLPETKYHTMAELSDMKGLRQCARETFGWMRRKQKDEQVSELQNITNED